jgi:hypothetical protein
MLCAVAVVAIALQPGLRPIEAGVGDVAPDRLSQRRIEVEQRIPTGFEQIYELTTPDGSTTLVRIAGGVYVTFDRSQYDARSGEALIPAGATFIIGSPVRGLSQTPAQAPNRVNLRPRTSEPSSPSPSSIGPPSIAGNELYRRIRVTQLLFSILKPRNEASEPHAGGRGPDAGENQR